MNDNNFHLTHNMAIGILYRFRESADFWIDGLDIEEKRLMVQCVELYPILEARFDTIPFGKFRREIAEE